MAELARSVRGARSGGSGPSRARVLFSFGRADALDAEALRRMVASTSRCLDPAEAAEVRFAAGIELLARFLGAKHLGGTHLLNGVWRRLGIAAGFGGRRSGFVANRFNLEVALRFLDTTTTHFELEGADPDVAADDEG